MAMNKTEQAMVADLKRELAMAKAFRFTDDILPDVPIPPANETTRGWTFNQYSRRVAPVVSRYGSHKANWSDDEEPEFSHVSGSQGGLALYSTKELALRALRRALEGEYARALAHLDATIDAERNKERSCP
jgi:hypothetical protein